MRWHHVLVLGTLLTGCHDSELAPATQAEPLSEAAPAREEFVANDPRGVWLAARPTQCSSSDVWRKDWRETHKGDEMAAAGKDEISLILRYCSKRGINVIDSQMRYEPITACAACTCPGNYIAFLLVAEEDAPKVASFGFRPQRP